MLHLQLQFNSYCACVCMKVRVARVVNAFSCALRGNMFSTLRICISTFWDLLNGRVWEIHSLVECGESVEW